MRLPGLGLALVVVLAMTASVSSAKAKPVAIHATPAAASGSWTVYHADDGHTGYDPTVPKMAGAAAGWTSPTLDGEVYAEPLIFNGIVYTATLNDTVYALNQSDGTTAWSVNVGPPQTSGWNCSGLHAGILSTPVIDTAANRIYVVAEIAGVTPTYHLFGIDLGTHAIVRDVAIAPAGFDWHIQQQRGALAVHGGFVYVPFGGRAGDCGYYSGWVVGVPTSGAGSPNVFQTPPTGNGIWAAGGVVIDDSTGNVFAATGNGVNHGGGGADGCAADVNGNPVFENNAVVRLSPTLAELDHFMPFDWQGSWCANDQDLGSASPLLINPNLMFQAGKWGTGFLLNPNSLGGVDGQLFPAPKPAPYGEVNTCVGNHSDATFGSFAYAAPFIYLECHGHGLVALSTNTAAPSFSPCDNPCVAPAWQAGGNMTFGPPIVAGGAVWVVDINTATGLYAFDAATGAQLYHSGGFGVNHFVTPAEAGGNVFVPAGTQILEFDMQFGCVAPIFTSYFNWFDNVTAGMVGDNIHLLNTGNTTSTGCVTLGARSIPFSLPPGIEQHVTFPPGTIGGPVVVAVTSGPNVLASQRVQYFQSFNEVWAMTAAQAALVSYIQWYDLVTQGMVGDNIHLLNPGSVSATVTLSLGAASKVLTVGPGAEVYYAFPVGSYGGPVKISSTQPVLASQRVQYFQSFNEALAHSGAQATANSYFNWFDLATPGMVGDNIHVLNPGTMSATVTVSLPGAASQTVTVAPGIEVHLSFGAGHINGPVTVSSTQPVLATQRVQYFQSFNEVPGLDPALAKTTSYIMWYDLVTAGMVGDNIHIFNPGGVTASLTVSLGGASKPLSVGPGVEAYMTFPAGSFGGPVRIVSNVPVLGAQRVQYFQSFNEVAAG